MINLLTILLLMVTFGLHVLSKWVAGEDWVVDLTTISQLLALWGIAMMSWSFVLSSRIRLLEKLFEGQDKIIKMHQWVGVGAFFLLIHHPILLAIEAFPYFDATKQYLFFSNVTSYNWGVGALFLMIGLLLLTVVVNLPYDLWLKTHDWMGGVLLLGMVHTLLIDSDVSRFWPLRWWILTLIGLGLWCFVYKVILYQWIGPKYKYLVKQVKVLGDVLEIELGPIEEKMSFEPGQFAYVAFEDKNLKEKHPFSISSARSDNNLKFSVKILGDYTLKLKRLKPGLLTTVWGPYGVMGRGFQGKAEVVMVAGGIGITPFLSMVRSEVVKPGERKMTLYYCAKTEAEMVYDNEIKELKTKLPNLEYYGRATDICGRINVGEILDKVVDKKMARFYLCGPREMMTSLAKQLAMVGIKKRKIIFEDFNFKI